MLIEVQSLLIFTAKNKAWSRELMWSRNTNKTTGSWTMPGVGYINDVVGGGDVSR